MQILLIHFYNLKKKKKIHLNKPFSNNTCNEQYKALTSRNKIHLTNQAYLLQDYTMVTFLKQSLLLTASSSTLTVRV